MKKQMTILMIIMAITNITYNMAHPVTPDLVDHMGMGSDLLGILFAAMSFANFLMSPIWGRLSDRYGRKYFLLIGPVGYGLSQIGFGFSNNLYAIIGFRLLAGIFASASMICGLAYLIDITSVKERSKRMVFYTAISTFSANIGYLLGGYIGRNDYHIAFAAQATASILLAVLILIILKESHHLKAVRVKTNMFRDLKQYRGTILPLLLLVVLMTSLIFKGYDTGLNSYLKFVLDQDSLVIGTAMAILGFIGLFTNFILFPIMKRRFDDLKVLIGSIVLMIIASISFVVFEQSVVRMSVLVVFFAALALYKPLLQSLISKAGNRNGEVMGLNNAANAIGMMFGSLSIGYIFNWNVNYAYLALALVAFLVFSLLYLFRKSIEPYTKEIIE